jgi:adenylate kinase family enzyme
MNIIDAYLKLNGQMIILISGMSGTRKSEIANFFSGLFGFLLFQMSDFYKENYKESNNYVELPNGDSILDWENIDNSIDWEKMNNHVNEKKKYGIILEGFGFPEDKINFKCDYHIHLKISKEKLLERREKYKEKHPGENIYDKNIEKLILNKITIPHYLKLRDRSKIDKYININENENIDEIKKNIFEFIKSGTQKWLKKYDDGHKLD